MAFSVISITCQLASDIADIRQKNAAILIYFVAGPFLFGAYHKILGRTHDTYALLNI